RDLAVTPDVELEPERSRGLLGNLFDRADRHRAQGVDGAFVGRRSRRQNLAAWPKHAAETGRGENQGRGNSLAEHVRRLIASADVDQDTGIEGVALKAGAVSTEGKLVLRSAVDVVEDRARQSAPGTLSQVIDIDDHFGALPNLRDSAGMERSISPDRCQRTSTRSAAVPGKCNSSPAAGTVAPGSVPTYSVFQNPGGQHTVLSS